MGQFFGDLARLLLATVLLSLAAAAAFVAPGPHSARVSAIEPQREARP
jgi:hypothetical protein